MAKPAPQMPVPVERPYQPFQVTDVGWWLNLSDVHIPFHDRATVEKAVVAAKKRSVQGVLLNGDIFDFHQLSRYDREPTAERYEKERRKGIEFLAYLRSRLRTARLVFKEGNHEERLSAYFLRNAPELFDLDVVQLPSLMQFERFGVEFVGDRRVIRLGKLNVIHGHEYRPGITAPVNPARGLFLRAKSVALCGHFHQTSEHHEPTITGRPQAAWSTGCACDLAPKYMPLNKWNHGFALVHVHSAAGDFEVRNLRVVDGKVV